MSSTICKICQNNYAPDKCDTSGRWVNSTSHSVRSGAYRIHFRSSIDISLLEVPDTKSSVTLCIRKSYAINRDPDTNVSLVLADVLNVTRYISKSTLQLVLSHHRQMLNITLGYLTLSQPEMLYQSYMVGHLQAQWWLSIIPVYGSNQRKKYYSLNRITKSSCFHIDGLVQNCCNSSAIALELLQSCTKAWISWGRSEANSLQWHHNERDGISNHQPHHCLLNRLLRWRSKKTSKLRVKGLSEGN